MNYAVLLAAALLYTNKSAIPSDKSTVTGAPGTDKFDNNMNVAAGEPIRDITMMWTVVYNIQCA